MDNKDINIEKEEFPFRWESHLNNPNLEYGLPDLIPFSNTGELHRLFTIYLQKEINNLNIKD
jgi:hypothetical protein